MADGYNFIPQKKWEQTPTGYYIVPIDQLDIKRSRTDENGTATIVRCTCPDCSDSRKRSHQNEPCVRLDMTTGLGKCYNCGFHFIISTKVKALSRHQPVKKENWKLPRTDHLKPLDAVAIDYLMKRGIRPETAKKAGVCSAHRVIGGTERHCLAFTFREGTKVVNIQYKTTDKLFAMEPDCEIIPWNIDACIGQESIIITEGMMDALALMELGYDNVISVSNGADTELRTFNRFRYSHFDSLKTIYLAGDMDEAGEQLRAKLAEYFGEARCRIVDWRIEQDDGESLAEKDANDMLKAHGADAVMQCVNHAQPCPITGVETVANYRERLFDIWQNGIQPGKKVGWGEFALDDHRGRAQHGQIDLCRRPGAEPRPAAPLEGRRLFARDVPTRTAHRPTGDHHRRTAVPQGDGHHRAGRGLSADRHPTAHGGAHRGLAGGEHLLRDRGEGAHHPQAAPPG